MSTKGDIHVFAYGSNMALERITARAASARAISVGCVAGRRLAFHKLGRDGSGKADAVRTDQATDKIWGVVLSLSAADKRLLDRHEYRYEQHQVCVQGINQQYPATIYSASQAVVDPTLKPFSWYHRFVIHGATQHRLPEKYIRHLETFETITDPDVERDRQNASLLINLPSPAPLTDRAHSTRRADGR